MRGNAILFGYFTCLTAHFLLEGDGVMLACSLLIAIIFGVKTYAKGER